MFAANTLSNKPVFEVWIWVLHLLKLGSNQLLCWNRGSTITIAYLRLGKYHRMVCYTSFELVEMGCGNCTRCEESCAKCQASP